MISELPREVRDGLRRARKTTANRKSRMRVQTGDDMYPIARHWEGGFAMDVEAAPKLRGFVDIYEGSRQLYQCLIVCSALDGDEMVYEFKRQTQAVDQRPVDFDQERNAPVALLT